MIEKIKDTATSREFQTGALQIGAAVASIIVSTIVTRVVNQGLNLAIEAAMDKIHGVEVKPE